MRQIEAKISTHIVVESGLLGPDLQREIVAALTIPNPEKPIALREHLYGAHSLPDTWELFYREGSFLRIPRGFIHSFIRGMNAQEIEIKWQDERTIIGRQGPELTPINLDPYQEIGCKALLDYFDGMISAPTGSGKTAMALEAIRRSKQRSIVIVEKSSLAAQWLEEIKSKLGFEAGYIGEGQWIERDITVALRQSLWAARDDRQRMARVGHNGRGSSFWQLWGMMLLDEAHHAPADTLVDLVQRFTAYIRGGVSATPDRDPLTFPIAQVVIGPVVHETTFEEAEARLVRPSVRVVETDFDFPDYHPTHKAKVWDEKRGKHVTKTIRNNYAEMMATLIHDEDRNNLIVTHVMIELMRGHHCLIVSSRKEHLEILEKMIAYAAQADLPLSNNWMWMLVGGDDKNKKEIINNIVNKAERGTVLLSTVADEGLDIPRLDRLFLVFPSRKTGSTKQKVGRITRKHPLKTDAIVYDFFDRHMDLLNSQFRERRQMYYSKDGLEVQMPERVGR